MTLSDTRRAIQVAHDTFKTFRTTTPAQRQQWLANFHRLVEDNLKDIARLIVWENGKSWTDAMAEATYAASFLSWFAGEALRSNGTTIPCSLPGTRNFTVKQPVGVCALLVPWNFPAAMIARKIGPVLATGCTAVIKVPSETPYTNLAIMEVSGEPSSCRRVVVANARTSSLNAPACPTVSSMSSPARPTCRTLARSSPPTLSSRRSVSPARPGSARSSRRTPVGLSRRCRWSLEGELAHNHTIARSHHYTITPSHDLVARTCVTPPDAGSNAPLIVFEDADLDTAVAGTIASKFRGSGQTCVCANRIYVHDTIYDKFASALADKVKQFKVGPGFDEGV
jgi:acyl-CoA reductase-like NAD-dependent aldehyde dehydrogenase